MVVPTIRERSSSPLNLKAVAYIRQSNLLLFISGIIIGSVLPWGGLHHVRRLALKKKPAKQKIPPFPSGGFLDSSAGMSLSNATDLFDRMHRHMYKIASKPHERNGKRYELGLVPQTKGGLRDTDRTLIASIYSNVTSVFEFGLGESTAIASSVGVPRYSGVDSDAVWVAMARDEAAKDNRHFRFSFADIGETRPWGNPDDNELKKLPLNYQASALYGELDAFDFYLVDGRYRIACVCASFLHAMGRGGDMTKVMVGMHDWDARNVYHRVLEFADLVKESERLVVLKLKAGTTQHDIVKMWDDHIWYQI